MIYNEVLKQSNKFHQYILKDCRSNFLTALYFMQ